MHSHTHPEVEERELRSSSAPAAGALASPGSGESGRAIGSFKTEKGNVRVIRTCNTALRDQLLALRDSPESKWSNNKIANRLGVASGQISGYLNERGCTYDGDIPKLERSLADFLRNEALRRASGVETINCTAAEQMLKAFNYIRKTNDVGAVIAEPGEGKSRGVELILEVNPLVILFHVRAWSNDKGSLASALWDVIPHVGYKQGQKRANFIVTSLCGSDRPLLVDDAHKLTRPALHLLFDLHDETRIPIILLGTAELIDKLMDDSQRLSRVGLHWTIKPATAERRKLLEHMIKGFAKDANGDREELLDLCEQVAVQHGHFRAVEKELKFAAELRSGKDKTWPQAFRDAHDLLLRQYKLQ